MGTATQNLAWSGHSALYSRTGSADPWSPVRYHARLLGRQAVLSADYSSVHVAKPLIRATLPTLGSRMDEVVPSESLEGESYGPAQDAILFLRIPVWSPLRGRGSLRLPRSSSRPRLSIPECDRQLLPLSPPGRGQATELARHAACSDSSAPTRLHQGMPEPARLPKPFDLDCSVWSANGRLARPEGSDGPTSLLGWPEARSQAAGGTYSHVPCMLPVSTASVALSP
jgi:hypothetical protein